MNYLWIYTKIRPTVNIPKDW